MAGFWENDEIVNKAPSKAGSGFWESDAIVNQNNKPKPKSEPYKVLPVSEDEKGIPRFDSNAGIFGAIKRAVTLPGDVVTGRIDPMSEEGISRATDLAEIASPVSAAAKTMRPSLVKTPTKDELLNAGRTGFDKARDMGVDYSSNSIKDFAATLQRQLEADGILEHDAPKTTALLNNLQSPPPDSVVPMSAMMSLRKNLGRKMRDFNNPTEQEAAGRAQSSLDDFMANPSPQSIVSGPGQEATQIFRDARGNYAAGKRAKTLDDADYRGDLNAATANSGMNVDNAIRQQAKSLLLNPKKLAGFSKEEIAALEDVAKGDTTRNSLRKIGNILGGGGGLASMVGGLTGGAAGAYFGSPAAGALLGAAVPTAGMAAKTGANMLAERAMSNVNNTVRQRSPLYNSLLQQTPGRPISPNLRSLPMRGLLLGLPPDQI
jgi:hypothetical protein